MIIKKLITKITHYEKVYVFFLLSSITLGSFAQAPQSFKYQAVARDVGGNVLTNQNVSFQISIVKGNTSGTNVYTEIHFVTTNAFGLVNLEIGNGTAVGGDFPSIGWGNDTYFLKVEMDGTGGSNYQLMGNSQLQSVPYALFAEATGDTSKWHSADDTIYTEKYVGIGTGSPTSKLHIRDDDSPFLLQLTRIFTTIINST